MAPKKIVIADDENNLLLLLRMILEEAGYTVFSACDGVEALALCQTQNPDLVITDYMMPRKNGLELCREMQADAQLQKIPVILSSALSDQGVARQGQDLGVKSYLSKPFSAGDLKKTVSAILG